MIKEHGLVVRPTDMKVQRGGRMVFSAAARVRRCSEACSSARVYRLKSNGTLDRSFGKRGLFSAGFGATSEVDSISLSSSGILAGGFAETSAGRNDALLFRLQR